jgi:hypothetical protein
MATDSQTAEYIQTTALSTGRRRLSWTTLSSSAVRVFPPDARSGGLQWQRWLALGLRQSRQLRDSRDNLGAREGCGPKKSLPCRANWWRGCCAQRFPSGSSTICCEPVVPVNMYLHRRAVCGLSASPNGVGCVSLVRLEAAVRAVSLPAVLTLSRPSGIEGSGGRLAWLG